MSSFPETLLPPQRSVPDRPQTAAIESAQPPWPSASFSTSRLQFGRKLQRKLVSNEQSPQLYHVCSTMCPTATCRTTHRAPRPQCNNLIHLDSTNEHSGAGMRAIAAMWLAWGARSR